MAMRQIELPDIGKVRLYKHSRSRSIKISLSGNSYVRVTLPVWLPYRAGIAFVQSRKQWIQEHQKVATQLIQGQRIGKGHRINFVQQLDVVKPQGRLVGSELVIKLPPGMKSSAEVAQTVAKQNAIKAIRREATTLLPQRLSALARQHDFSYREVSVRQLRSRWGSCSHKKNITLNIYLMQLPWELIDYVLMHELTHTEVLHHGPDFWKLLVKNMPKAKSLRKQLKEYSPTL